MLLILVVGCSPNYKYDYSCDGKATADLHYFWSSGIAGTSEGNDFIQNSEIEWHKCLNMNEAQK
jgi:hypothetical protein